MKDAFGGILNIVLVAIFLVIVAGILGLVVESFRTTISSVLILIFGIIGLLVEKFGSNVSMN